jgi:predicted SAM-dependent methyltransferase
MDAPKRIDIGCGPKPADGFTAWEIKDGKRAESLEGIADGSLDAIRASHVLEHIPHAQTVDVLREWSRALRIGGALEVAVPDFDRIVNMYTSGSAAPIEGYLMGGQIDEHDRHYAIFNRQKLTECAAAAGFDFDGEWTGDAGTCAALPVSLNLRFVKRGRMRFPLQPMPDVCAVMTVPRLLWTENIHCVSTALSTLQIPIVRSTGVFWGACLQRIMSDVIGQRKFKYVLAIDYDSIFDAHDIAALYRIAEEEKLDALCALQIGRDRDQLITALDDGTGKPLRELPVERLKELSWSVLFAHFGLTLIRTDRLAELPKPWFLGDPGEDGEWADKRVDEDVYFWRKARDVGWKIGMTPQVRIGHLQMVATWAGSDLQPVFQYMPDFHKNGRPQW